MTDYNDGNWHGWNGGECPVHPKSEVDVIHKQSGILNTRRACITSWFSSNLVAFRVVKTHREPREFWVTYDAMGKIGVFDSPVRRDAMHEVIHVREVIE